MLLEALGRVVAAARPLGDGRVALLGHSMAADIVIRWAFARPEVAATVAFSGFGPEVTAAQPRNLLVAVGAWEPAFLQDAARRIVALASPGPPEPETTYGDFAAGTARRLVVVQGVEHIGILYARQSLVEARAWLNAAFGRSGEGMLDTRGGAIGLLLGGLLALAWPLSHLLPRAAAAPAGGGLPWRRFWPIALLPAIATPLLLRLLPTSFLPILLGDYLTVHCAVYGVLTAAGLWWTRARATAPGGTGRPAGRHPRRAGDRRLCHPRPRPGARPLRALLHAGAAPRLAGPGHPARHPALVPGR